MSEHRSEGAGRSSSGTNGVLERAAEAIGSAESLALACHQMPDGDALGSMLALQRLAQRAGKPAVASWPEPFSSAPHYSYLPGLDRATKPADFPAAPEVMVTFDCGSIERLGELAGPARAARTLVVVDHHATNDGFGTIDLIDPHAAASAVIVRRLVDRLGWPLDREAAICLYTGIVCDTGRFQYENTTPEVFEMAAELTRYGIPVGAISRQLFEEHRLAYLQLVADALQRVELDSDKRFVATWVTADDLTRNGVDLEETEGLIDLVRRTSEADVSCVLKEAPDGTRVSLRAVSDVDVGAIATSFGGGGHKAAAGFKSDRPVNEVLDAIRAAIPNDP
ncbi:MAG TPA: bifunctional oligoribonuclease/PAP phosphatase NrnA [Acidimicrobiales bacterium]|nr:bifunctional oligoribonuclease/PAP phosphatase NrnA [Acidimicrobiales bacterium]